MHQPNPIGYIRYVKSQRAFKKSDRVTHHQPSNLVHSLTVAFTIVSSIALPVGASLALTGEAIASPHLSELHPDADSKNSTLAKQVEVNLPPLEDQSPSINIELEQEPPPELELDDFDFWAEQCQTLVQGQQYEEGLNACNEAIAIDDKGKRTLPVWAARAEALTYQGQYVDALNSLDQVLAEDISNSLLITQQCVAYVHSGNYEEAVDSCETALATNGNWGTRSPAFAWYYRGIALQELGFMETSLWSFERAARTVGLGEEAPEASMVNGNADTTVDPPPLSIPGFISPVAEPLGHAEWCHTLHLFGGRDRYEFAQQSPLEDCGLDQTIAYYEQATQQYPQDIILRQRQGLALEQLGDYTRALAAYDQGLLVTPEHPKLLSRKCGMLNQLDRYEEAFAACELALESPQPQPVLDAAYGLTQYSVALLGLERYDEALAATERAIATHSTYGPAYTSKAVSLWYLGRNDDAEKMAQATLDIYQQQEANFADTFYRPNVGPWPLFYRDYGIAFFNQGRILASNPQQQPSNLNPLAPTENLNGVKIAYLKSICYPVQQLEAHWPDRIDNLRLCRLDVIPPLFRSTLRTLRPSVRSERTLAILTSDRFVDTLLNLSAISLGTDPSQSLEFATIATNLDPNSFIGWYNMALAAKASGQLKVAEYAFGVAQQINPEHPYIALHQANTLIAYRVIGADGIVRIDPEKVEEAIALYTQILTDDPSNNQAKDKLMEIGADFLAFGKESETESEQTPQEAAASRIQEAIALYTHILVLDPAYERAKEAILDIGTLLLARGQQLDAIATYDYLLNIDPNYQLAQIARTNALAAQPFP